MLEPIRRARTWVKIARFSPIFVVFALSSCSLGGDSSAKEESTAVTSGPGVSVEGSDPQTEPDLNDGRSWFDVLGDQAQTSFPAGKYVSPSGNNSNGGTSPSDAWKTVGHGISQVQAGETLFLMGGTYNESLSMNRAGRPDAWIRITAYPGEKPVITQFNSNGIQFENGASYIELSGIEFAGNPDPNHVNGSWPGGGVIAFTGSHHIRVYNNNIHNYGAGGVVGFEASHLDVRNNVIYENAFLERNQHSGISFFEFQNIAGGNDSSGYSNYAIGNLVFRNENKRNSPSGDITDGNCVIVDRFDITGYNGRTLIADNICIDNGGRALNVFKSSGVDVFNNTAYHNLRTPRIAQDGGEMFAYQSSDVHFANNLIFARPGIKPVFNVGSNNIAFTNNMYVGDQNPNVSGNDMYHVTGTPVVNNASTDGKASNFDLISGSPAIDSGASQIPGPVKTDHVGRPRVQGGAPDVGAYEFRSSGSDPAPTTAPPATAAPATSPPTTAAPSTGSPTTKAPTTGSPTTKAPTTRAPSTTESAAPTDPGSDDEPEVAAPAPSASNPNPSAAPSPTSGDPSGGSLSAPAPSAQPSSPGTPTTAPSVFAPENGLAPTTIGPPPQAPVIDDSPVVTTDSGVTENSSPDLAFVESDKSNGSGLWIALSLLLAASGFGAMQASSGANRLRQHR